MKTDWKQLLIIAGGAAATGVALYYLLRPEGPERRERESDPKKLTKKDATKEQVLMVLRDILATQEKMKALMKKFTQRFVEEEPTFEEACAIVSKQHPEDPLGPYGLSMKDFDSLLDKFQQDPEVKDSVLSIMGSASTATPSGQAYSITKERLIEVHEFMRDELQSLAIEAESWPKMDPKVLTLAAQSYVGAKVQKKFGLTGEDIEGAVLLHHKELATNATFTIVNMTIQKIMNDLVGAEE